MSVAKSGAQEGDMRPLFDTFLAHVPAPAGAIDAPLQFQVSALDYSSYVGRLGVGRIRRGSLAPGQEVALLNHPLPAGENPLRGRAGQLILFQRPNPLPLRPTRPRRCSTHP